MKSSILISNCNMHIYYLSFMHACYSLWTFLVWLPCLILIIGFASHCRDVVLASNRKAIDQHISLFKWSMEDNKRGVVSLEFRSDKYTPKIEVPGIFTITCFQLFYAHMIKWRIIKSCCVVTNMWCVRKASFWNVKF